MDLKGWLEKKLVILKIYLEAIYLRIEAYAVAFGVDTRAVGARTAIMLGVAFFLIAVVFPIGMTQVTAANTTDWNTAVTTVFTVLLPILAVIGLAIKFLPGARR